MRLLNAPDNAEHLLESSGYVVSSAKDDDRPVRTTQASSYAVAHSVSQRGHVIHAKRCSDGASVVVKCTRKEGSEARMMTYFYHLRKLGKSLPVVGNYIRCCHTYLP
jgi:hypothetical protein